MLSLFKTILSTNPIINHFTVQKYKEKFTDNENDKEIVEYINYSLYSANLAYLVILSLAIFVSLKCFQGGNFFDLLLAFFFAPFYLIYHLFASGWCGALNK